MLRCTALSLALLALCVVVQTSHIPSCSACHLLTSPSDKYPCNCNECVVRPAPQCCPCATLPFKLKCPHAHCPLYGKHHAFSASYYKPSLIDMKSGLHFPHPETSSVVNPCCHDSKYVPAAKPCCCKVCKPLHGYSKHLLDLGCGKLHYHDGIGAQYHGGSGVNYHEGDHEYQRYTTEPDYYHHGRYDQVAAYNHDDVHGYMVRDDALLHPSHDFYFNKGLKSHRKATLIPGDYGVHPHQPVEYVRDGDEHARIHEDFLDADEAKRYSSGEVNAKTGLRGCRSREPVDLLSLTLVRNAALKAQRAAQVKEEGLAYGFRQQPKEVKKEVKRYFEEEGKLAAYDKDVIELKKFHSPTILKEETFEYEDYPGDAHTYEDTNAEMLRHKLSPSYDELGFKKVEGTCGRTVSTCVHDRVDYKVPVQPCVNPECRAEKCDCY